MRHISALIVLLLFSPVALCQDFAKERLNNSPRHHEWVAVKNGDKIVHCFVVFPEVKDKATAVLVIHENRGLTDWVRSVADQLAEAGYIAIAPDLLSGMGPDGGKTSDFKAADDAGNAIRLLKTEQVLADLNAVADHVIKLPSCNGKLAVGGFCWGGGYTFRFATARPDLKAAFVFYGAFQHTKEDLSGIKCPVYGFYGGNDNRINSTIPRSADMMKDLGKTYEPKTYDGAGHGFMGAGEDPNGNEANRKARKEAWERWKELLKKV